MPSSTTPTAPTHGITCRGLCITPEVPFPPNAGCCTLVLQCCIRRVSSGASTVFILVMEGHAASITPSTGTPSLVLNGSPAAQNHLIWVHQSASRPSAHLERAKPKYTCGLYTFEHLRRLHTITKLFCANEQSHQASRETRWLVAAAGDQPARVPPRGVTLSIQQRPSMCSTIRTSSVTTTCIRSIKPHPAHVPIDREIWGCNRCWTNTCHASYALSVQEF